MSKRTLIVLIAFASALVACKSSINASGPTVYPSTFNNALIPPLLAGPSNISISGTQSVQLRATGGIPPYTYNLISGSGTVGFNSGLFQASSISSNVAISVFDSSGLSTIISITVNGSSSAPTPTPPTTVTVGAAACTSMLSDANVAIRDTSATGVASAVGWTEIADPTDCVTYCDSLGAGYCMWSSGGGTSTAICIGWPTTAAMETYQPQWTTYGGSCTLAAD